MQLVRHRPDMGLVYADIQIRNPSRPALTPIVAKALVDTGANYLCLPSHLAVQLGLLDGEPAEMREVRLADGSSRAVPYVGPIQLRFKNRSCFVGAMVLGEQVLMGAIPLEDMDLVVSPSTMQLDVNPNSPNFPSALAMLSVSRPRDADYQTCYEREPSAAARTALCLDAKRRKADLISM